MQANLAELPLPAASVDVVVNFQVIEHLWDQAQFVPSAPGCCARRAINGVHPQPGHLLPGSRHPDQPVPHPRTQRAEPAELLVDAGSARVSMRGYSMVRGWSRWTPATAAPSSTRRSLGRSPMGRGRAAGADVAAVTTDDFDLVEAGERGLTTVWTSSRSRSGRDQLNRPVPGMFTLVLHTHLPWLAHHGRWPVGEEWLYQRGRRPTCR